LISCNCNYLQVVELVDASAVNASAVRLDWMVHEGPSEKFVEVNLHKTQIENLN